LIIFILAVISISHLNVYAVTLKLKHYSDTMHTLDKNCTRTTNLFTTRNTPNSFWSFVHCLNKINFWCSYKDYATITAFMICY